MLSDGRFELGMGAGWHHAEYEQVGMPFDSLETRHSRLEEAIGVMKRLFSAEPYRVVEKMMQMMKKHAWEGVTAEQVLDMPYYLIGSTDYIIEKLQMLRERYHISYFVVADDRDHDALVPIVAHLAGL